MIVDASAFLAILLKEPEEKIFEAILIGTADPLIMSPVNYLEICLRVDRGEMPEISEKLDEVLARFNVELAKITPEQAYLARKAYQKYGRGRHPAKLNLGDCFAYALSKARDEPLLFKGKDFPLTDVEAATA